MLVQKKRVLYRASSGEALKLYFRVMACFSYSKSPQTPCYGICKNESSKYLQKSKFKLEI